MEQWAVLAAGEKVSVDVRRKANARRLSLRVNQTDGRVSVTAPKWVSGSEIKRFLDAHRAWLGDALVGVADREMVAHGVSIPIEGKMTRIAVDPSGKGRGATHLRGDVLEVSGPQDQANLRVRSFLKILARDRLVPLCDLHSQALGHGYKRLTLRDTRSRWGSCSSSGGLMFSWRLVMAPPDVLNYVAAHEVAHLAEMNHSARFWETVARLMPDFEPHRMWLRENGKSLHRWQFEE